MCPMKRISTRYDCTTEWRARSWTMPVNVQFPAIFLINIVSYIDNLFNDLNDEREALTYSGRFDGAYQQDQFLRTYREEWPSNEMKPNSNVDRFSIIERHTEVDKCKKKQNK